MKGDFSRDTFDPMHHFSQVLMQQGRVTVDADGNEQARILLHYLRTLARDLIGPYAAPVEHAGFQILKDDNGVFRIGPGRYYVDGILVENEDDHCLYTAQPDYPLPDDDPLRTAKTGPDIFWIYLDVWERHITHLEEDAIRETALGGPDTCTRAKVVWQVKTLKLLAALEARRKEVERMPDGPAKTQMLRQLDAEIQKINRGRPDSASCETSLDLLTTVGDATMAARVDPGLKVEDACVTPPSSKFRGAENQLYRVEIHEGGIVDLNNNSALPSFKWSRDNGSLATAWLGTAGSDLQVANPRGFSAGNWVELSDDNSELLGHHGVLVKIAKVEGDTLSVDPDSVPAAPPDAILWNKNLVNPKIRRWDQTQTEDIVLRQGAVPIMETPANASEKDFVWIDLEDGIQIRFSAGGEYRTGDYWLIPARVATGGIEWPSATQGGKSVAELLPPRGIEHHYAPLGFARRNDKTVDVSPPCRCDFLPLSSCFHMGSSATGAQLLFTPSRDVVTAGLEVAEPAAPRRSVTRKKKREG